MNRVVHQHLTCSDFISLPEAKLDYFLASFVRNPYDKVYSGFLQMQRDIKFQPNMKFEQPWVKNLVISQLIENHQVLIKANHDFNNWIDLIDDYKFLEQGRNTNFPLHPAHYWTHIADNQFVDFIGKVENLESDIKILAKTLEIKKLPVINSNVTKHDSDSIDNINGYRYLERMKPSTIRKINFIFNRDFELFGYKKIEL